MSISLQQTLLEGRGCQGIYSVCSANRWVIEAAMQQALEDGSSLLLEATCNQVNQEGGYTGMTPADFRDFAYAIAGETVFPKDKLILGGDHLGPNPWQKKSASEAMKLAAAMVRAYVEAGFTKIHLDASMPCADDPAVLDDAAVAERAARLCAAAEDAAKGNTVLPVYIIGTEVPPPGGASHSLAGVNVTRIEDVERTLTVHRDVFAAAGLERAWERVLAIVVQPGVEFDHDSVIGYNAAKAEQLQPFLTLHPQMVFEAHSTDYQRPDAYVELIRDGYAILKVGPALTFAMREALYALAAIERELIPGVQQSNLPAVLEKIMLEQPEYWKKYYQGSAVEERVLRHYSYSDRIRYYWHEPAVQRSITRLIENLKRVTIPETMLSQYLPKQYEALRAGLLKVDPVALVHDSIRNAIRPYAAACLGTAASQAAN